jgi:hypothetical protein
MATRDTLLAVPVLGAIARRVKRAARARAFPGSGNYWERRYRQGDNSGAGSYGRLAAFKAEVLNEFVAANDISSVVELGSGDGAQLQLADYPDYTGVDVAQTCVDQCRRLFADDASKRFVHNDDLAKVEPHELALSLDVVYHLVEDEVFERYMADLFRLATRFVIVYASNIDKSHAVHVRHRRFTDWVDHHAENWSLIETIPNRYPAAPGDETDDTSFADFYVFALRRSNHT